MNSRLFSLASSVTWAMEASWVTAILKIANREGRGPEALAAELGRPLDNTQRTTMRRGVAVIPVRGPITRYANLFNDVSGATSIELLARDFNASLVDPKCTAIVLEIDSPGGEVTGINEFAAMVYAARGSKPIVAYVGGLAASAGYWVASAADEIVCDRTAQLGSIGIVAGVPNPDAKTAEEIEIVSSQSPDKRPDVKTKEGRATIQDRVDALADVFLDVVARNRGVDVATVLKDFGRGGLLVGAEAVRRGVADRLGSLEAVVGALASEKMMRTPAAARLSKGSTSARAPAPRTRTLEIATPVMVGSFVVGHETREVEVPVAAPKAEPPSTEWSRLAATAEGRAELTRLYAKDRAQHDRLHAEHVDAHARAAKAHAEASMTEYEKMTLAQKTALATGDAAARARFDQVLAAHRRARGISL